MDEQSLQYIADTCRKLRDLAELSGANNDRTAFIAEQLKRFGCKPKTVGASVYCDVGRGKSRLAFFADVNAPSVQAEEQCRVQTAILLNVARTVGTKSAVPLRFIFGCGSDLADSAATDGVYEAYALRPCREIEHGKIGYCYGVTFAGRCEFTVDFYEKSDRANAALKSAQYLAEQALTLAQARSVSLTVGNAVDNSKREYTVVFYDLAACEGFMIDLERAALKADDINGTAHKLCAQRVFPPSVNNALAVDRVRSLMCEKCAPIKPFGTSDSFSELSEKTAGCTVLLGVGDACDNSPSCISDDALLTGTELFKKLIESFKA